METFGSSFVRFSSGLPASDPFYLFHGRPDRNPGGGAPRTGAGRRHFPSSAGHLPCPPGGFRDHARRDLLWRHVRGVHNLDPGEPPGGSGFGGNLHGRIPDGPQRTSRRRPGDIRLRILHCGDRRGHRAQPVWPLLSQPMALRFRAPRILCRHGPRPHHPDLSGRRDP